MESTLFKFLSYKVIILQMFLMIYVQKYYAIKKTKICWLPTGRYLRQSWKPYNSWYFMFNVWKGLVNPIQYFNWKVFSSQIEMYYIHFNPSTIIYTMYVCILNKLRSSKAQNIFLFQRHVFTYFEDRTHFPTHNQYFIEHILGVADRTEDKLIIAW